MQTPRECGKRESSIVDDAEKSASKNPEGGVLDDHLKPIVKVKKKRKIVK